MPTTASDFTYFLPQEHIAQTPAEPRESAKLMVLNRAEQTRTHHHVSDLPSFFRSGDIVVINNTKVFRARLHGLIKGKQVELFLVRPEGNSLWLALGRPGKKFQIGQIIEIAPDFIATVHKKHEDGTLTVGFGLSAEQTIAKANTHGSVPLPPYIKTIADDATYQTSYAKHVGSVAAPTAGFHLTPQIRQMLTNQGVTFVEITLHVGLGTFLPIKSDTLESHAMHSEWVQVSEEAARIIKKAKQEKKRVIAIGTTTVRTLEGVAAKNNGEITAYEGDVSLFITPGFQFRIIDGMLTNFHLPKSTLLVLVSAFATREFILSSYEDAVRHNYRFYSFGDAMLIV
jgi:S-adenosylmethionine:tRNA ribosyltransferase-isomerase